jgi:hypothetical protein
VRTALDKLRPHAFILLVTLAALALRLFYNLRLHPPGLHVYSDMAGYFDRSTSVLDDPFGKQPGDVVFPYGTHLFLAAVRAVFGRQNRAALAVAFAVLGALLVPLVHALAARLSKGRLVPRLAALATCVYFPWIALGGYYLSEIPFAVCLTAAALFALRLADHGRDRDAFLLGVSLALGTAVRPQILLSALLLFLFWLARRRAFPRVRRGHLVRAAIPLLLVLAFSAARFHHHTGRLGLVSANGYVNWAFGRCHATRIDARAPGALARFIPPPMTYLRVHERNHPDTSIRLDPALHLELSVRGAIWQKAPFERLARTCMERTGPLRQLRYALTHVALLWGYNEIWPDSGTPAWITMHDWLATQNLLLLPPLLVALALAFGRRHARQGLVAVHLFALFLVAMLYFGDLRFRIPYDGLALVLALDVLHRGGRRLLGLAAAAATRLQNADGRP